jgi:CBS domain-containing protein
MRPSRRRRRGPRVALRITDSWQKAHHEDREADAAENRISGLPVCDEEGHVLGVVSEADTLVKEQGIVARGRLAVLLDLGPERSKVAATTAGEAMTEPAICTDSQRRAGRLAARI